MEIILGHECVCMKCGMRYYSGDESDAAGDGRCKECAKRAHEIALRIDALIAERRKKRGYVEPKKQDIKTQGVYINARDLLGNR